MKIYVRNLQIAPEPRTRNRSLEKCIGMVVKQMRCIRLVPNCMKIEATNKTVQTRRTVMGEDRTIREHSSAELECMTRTKMSQRTDCCSLCRCDGLWSFASAVTIGLLCSRIQEPKSETAIGIRISGLQRRNSFSHHPETLVDGKTFL